MNMVNEETLREQLEEIKIDSDIEDRTFNRIIKIVNILSPHYTKLNINDWISIIMTSIIYLTNNESLPSIKKAKDNIIKYGSVKSAVLLSIEKYIGKENIDYINSTDLYLIENGIYDDALDEQFITNYGFSIKIKSKRM